METHRKDFQKRLEWARRKISDVVTEINTTQIYMEKIHERVLKQLKVIRRFEEAVTGAAIRFKLKTGNLSAYYSGDKEYIPLWLSALYSRVALDLENDMTELKHQASKFKDDCTIGKVDLINPLFEEIVTIAMSYIHVVDKFRSLRDSTNRSMSTYISSRTEVQQRSDCIIECLKVLVETNMSKYQGIVDDFFKNSTKEQVLEDEDSIPAKIPPKFIEFIDKRKSFFENYMLPDDTLLYTMTEEHLSPAVLIQRAIETILDHVSSRAHTARQSGKAHQLVLDHAEQAHRSQLNEPCLTKDMVQIMDYYSQNRVKTFYADCYYALLKKAAVYQKKFHIRCGCMEPFHISVGRI